MYCENKANSTYRKILYIVSLTPIGGPAVNLQILLLVHSRTPNGGEANYLHFKISKVLDYFKV